ncbi:MAG: phosphoribosylamine--glycine ligase, partial [Thermoguttaceae bacterium]|nr:phosphoribosylamine--glycine ligase [Thermoguttaceae bacterium]
MNILIVGNGGREHALAWKIAQSPRAEHVYVAPGNAGTARDAENVNLRADDFAGLVRFAKDARIGLTIVGPEAPLAAGIVDVFEREGLRIFGPTKAAAELESSKVFCKDLLRSANVPSADYRTFRDFERAVTFLQQRDDVPIVVLTLAPRPQAAGL